MPLRQAHNHILTYNSLQFVRLMVGRAVRRVSGNMRKKVVGAAVNNEIDEIHKEGQGGD